MELPPEYTWVLISVVINAFVLFLMGAIFGAGSRSKWFTDAVMAKSFSEHKSTYPNETEMPKGGYPDTGSGRYSAQLPYKGWLEFNSSQRAHLNLCEQIWQVIVFIAISGLGFPFWAAGLGGGYALSRIIYAIGYKVGGPVMRIPGAIIADLTFLPLIGLSVASIWREAFYWGLIAIVVLLFFVTLLGFGFPFSIWIWNKVFSKEFLSQFSEEHREALGGGAKVENTDGYPDMGNGRFADKLPYIDWFKFNVGQRIHLQMWESIIMVTLSIFALSLEFDIVAGIVGALILLGRIAYGLGYTKAPGLWLFGGAPTFIIMGLSGFGSLYVCVHLGLNAFG